MIKQTPTVSVVIPAYNESERIGATVTTLVSCDQFAEVIVVDDGSTDATGAIAGRCGAKVFRLDSNCGKGKALQFGWRCTRGDIVVFLDADLGETAGEAIKLVEPIASGVCDMAIARFPKQPWRGGVGMVVRLARWGIRACTNHICDEPLSGQRAVRRDLLERLEPLAPGFGVEVGMTIDALRLGGTVLEIPTQMSHRLTGRDVASVQHRARQFYDVARALAARGIKSKQVDVR